MVKISLIEPPYQFIRKVGIKSLPVPLLWMMCLGTYLKEMMGKEALIEYLDGQILGLPQILEKLKKTKPQFIGLCPKYSSYENALIIARAAKKLGSKVIMGGPHAGPLAKEILLNRGPESEDYCVDACVNGDGEEAIHGYIAERDPRRIKNLVFVKNGKIIENPVEYLDSDKLPMIDRSLINHEPYFRFFGKDVWPVFSHKGCFYGNFKNQGCIFCGGNKKLRLKSAAVFWREIDTLVKRYNVHTILNLADALPLDRQSGWFKEFYASSKLSRKPLKFTLRTLPRFIDAEIVKILKEWNVYSVRMPITDIYPGCCFRPFKNYHGENLKTFIQPFKLLSKAGIIIETYCKLGAFNEGREDLEKILKLSRLLLKFKNVRIIFVGGYLPLPGSASWRMLLEKTGDKYKNRDLIDWTEASLDWIKYFSDPEVNSMAGLVDKTILDIH